MAKIALVATDAWYVWNFRATTIRRLIAEGYDVTVYCGNRAYLGHVKALGARPVHIELDGRRVRPLQELGALLHLARALRRDRPDVVLSFNPKGNLYSGLVRNILRFGWIANVSGLGVLGEAQGMRGQAIAALFRVAFRKIDHTFFQNDIDLANWTKAAIVPDIRASRQYGTGVNLEEFAEVAPPDGPLEVVCIARLLEKKGIGEYIVLAEKVRARVPEVHFLLAGALVPADQGGFPADRIEAAEAAGHIQFLGMLDDVRPVLAGRTIGCLLTRYKEGIPRSMIEFLATSRPILVSEFDGASDLVPGKENGQIVDLGAPDWLDTAATFVEQLATDPAHYGALCAEARNLAERRFDGDVGIDEYVAHIERLLKLELPE